MRSLDFDRIDHVYIRPGYTDLRKGIDGLCLLVQSSMKLDPRQNILFLFCGRKTSTIKGLLWEEDGFMLITKRLYRLPLISQTKPINYLVRVLIDPFFEFFDPRTDFLFRMNEYIVDDRVLQPFP